MKLFYIKQGKNKRPINGGALLANKPAVGNYCPVVVGDDVKVPVNLNGSFPEGPILENTSIEADLLELYAYSDYHAGSEYSYIDASASMMPYDAPKTVGQLIENFNKKCGHIGHLSLENGIIYLTKNNTAAKLVYVNLYAAYLSNWI